MMVDKGEEGVEAEPKCRGDMEGEGGKYFCYNKETYYKA